MRGSASDIGNYPSTSHAFEPTLGESSGHTRAAIAESAANPGLYRLRCGASRVEVARPTMPVQIMQPSDVEFVDALAVETGFELNLQEESTRDFARLWVARLEPDSSTPDGFLLAWIAADELHIIAVGTRPAQRRRGLGRQLVRALIDFGRTNHSRLLILEVRRSNRSAIALYRSFGFSVSRLRRGYYANPSEDGIEMQLVLDDQGNIVSSVDEVPCLEVLECPT